MKCKSREIKDVSCSEASGTLNSLDKVSILFNHARVIEPEVDFVPCEEGAGEIGKGILAEIKVDLTPICPTGTGSSSSLHMASKSSEAVVRSSMSDSNSSANSPSSRPGWDDDDDDEAEIEVNSRFDGGGAS